MNNNKINIVIANASIKNGNKGCEALSYSTVILVKHILTTLNLEYNICVETDGKCKSCSISNDNIRIETINLPVISSIKGMLLNILRYKDFVKSRRAFKSADLLLDIGEGDSFSDIYGERRFYGIRKSSDSAHKFKIPYCLLPQTIGPFKNDKVKRLAIDTMKKALLVMTRDNQSLKKVKEYDSSLSPKEYIDLAFLLPYNKYNFDKSKKHIGINVSALLWNGGYTKNNQFNLKSNYRKLILNLIDEFLNKDNDIIIHLISHVYGLDKNGVENDFSVMTEIYKKFNNPRIVLAPLAFDPIDVKSYIAGMDFFVGARMHATIAAFSSGVPVVPTAYSRKFNGLFEDTLKYPYMVDLKVQDETESLSAIMSAFDERANLSRLIQNRLKTVVHPRLDQIKKDLSDIIMSVINGKDKKSN